MTTHHDATIAVGVRRRWRRRAERNARARMALRQRLVDLQSAVCMRLGRLPRGFTRVDLGGHPGTLAASMRPVLVFSALATMLGLSACSKIEARDLIREGNALYGEGKAAEAIEKYNAAEELEPDGVTLYWNRACAAEAMVLKIRDPDKLQDRARFADMALRDFQTWYDRLQEKTPEDEKQVHDHRLALLDADERCDDLLTYWLEKHKAEPKEEGLYGVIARTYEKCGKHDKTTEWYVKRTEDFPQSVRAWHSLAIRKFEPLWPDPEAGLPYNEAIAPTDRLKHADDVIATLDQATKLDPKFRDAYIWRSMAYTQKSMARVVIEDPQTAEEKLEAVLARADLLLAWKQQKAVCDLESLPECPKEGIPEGPCCPPPPVTEEERQTDAALRAELEQEIADMKAGKKRKRRRRRR